MPRLGALFLILYPFLRVVQCTGVVNKLKSAHSTSKRGAVQKSRHLRVPAFNTAARVPEFIQDPDAADDPTPHRVVVLYKEGSREGMMADLALVEAVIDDSRTNHSLPPFAFQDGLLYKLHHEMDKWNLLALTASTSILKWLAEKKGSNIEVMELDQIREASINYGTWYPTWDSLGQTGSGAGDRDLLSTTEPISFWPLNMIQALDLFEKSFIGDGVTICIVDSGVNGTKAGFYNSTFIGGESFISNLNWQSSGPGDCSHGTLISGIIAANGAAEGPLGVAHGANIAVVRVLNDSCGLARVSDILMASLACHLHYDARIINIGYSGGEYSSLEEAIMADATLIEDILFVAAAGDDGGVDDLYPAAYEHVMSVAAVDRAEDLATFSQSNFHVDIAAPGFRVGTLDFASDAVAYGSGTDMAAAFVSGIAAVLLSAMPEKTLSEVRSAIEKTAKRMGAEDYDADDNGSRNNDYGHGIVKANAAMNCLLDDTKCVPFKVPAVRTNCVDVPEGWHDVDGPEFDCEWYSLYDRCAILGDKFAKWDDVSANQACCACGGGSAVPIPTPTVSPAETITDTPAPAPAPAPSPPPIPSSETEACIDNPLNWSATDENGTLVNCAWYDASMCKSKGGTSNADGVSATKACCICEGGQRQTEWKKLSETSFEKDLGEWTSVGSRADRVRNEAYAFSGNFILEVGSGVYVPRSYLVHSVVDVTNLMELLLTLSFVPATFESGQSIWIEKSLDFGLNWTTVAKFTYFSDSPQAEYPPYIRNIQNGKRHNQIQVPIDVAVGEKKMKIAILLDVNLSPRHALYIDDVILQGKESDLSIG